MSREDSPNSNSYEYNSNNSSPNRKAIPEQDMLSQLKVKVFEKDQNKGNYNNLLSKFKKLQDELAKISEIKKQHEASLKQFETDQRNKDIIDLKNKNENLFNDLNERIALNKKLYRENNNLFRELESKTQENMELQEQIWNQEYLLQRLSCEKEDIEKKIYNLTQIKGKQDKQILDLTSQINILSAKNDDQSNLLKNRNDKNIKLINELNEEKNIYKNLTIELRNKEVNLASCQQKLNCANDDIKALQNNIDNLTNLLTRNKEEISTVDKNLLKESTVLNQLISNNTHLNELVEDRNNHIKTLNIDNDIIKKNNSELNCDNTKFKNLIQAYKKHLILLISQNKKLVAEIQFLLGRDKELRNILERDNYLQDIRYENDNLINSSLEKIKACLDSDPKQTIEEPKTSSIKKTYSIERNEYNRNNDPKNYNDTNTNINMNGSRINLDPSNINQNNDLRNSQENFEGLDMGEEEMINISENEQ